MSVMLSMLSVVGMFVSIAVKAGETPSLELLEFLGNWEDSDGEWQDPMELMKELEVLEADAQTVKVEEVSDGQ